MTATIATRAAAVTSSAECFLEDLAGLQAGEAHCIWMAGRLPRLDDFHDQELWRDELKARRRELSLRWQQLADALAEVLPLRETLPGGFRIEVVPSGQRVLARDNILFTGDRSWRRQYRTQYIAAQPGQWPKFGALVPYLLRALY
jgi:hypothetical protein